MEKSQTQFQREYHYLADTTSPSYTRRDRIAQPLLRRTLIAISLGFLIFVGLSWSPISLPNFNFLSCHKSANHPHDAFSSSAVEGKEALVMEPLLETPSKSVGNNRVPLEAHIMSKCPDARDCLQQLVVPAMEQISDLVDFELSFIASVSNKSSEINCMHGPTECIGDMLILCASNLPFPPESHCARRTPTIRSLGFANCLISSYHDIPERSLVEQCALEHGIDFEALNSCASQQDDDPGNGGRDQEPLSGIALLRKSAIRSEELGVKTSCTIRLDETVWCVRDGGVWRDCAEEGKGSEVPVFVEEVKNLWRKRN